jgi:uncharacterized SAM-binding protein YcdF (DUF218 family)
VAGLLAWRPLLRALPEHLVAREAEEPADAIVVLAGDQGERVEQAVSLYRRGLSRTGIFVCSGGVAYHKTTWAALMAAHAEELLVPKEKILLQDRSRTTVEDARFTLELLRARGDVKSIVLVTSSWHSRRAKSDFEREAGGSVRVISCPAPPPSLDGRDWWQDAATTRSIVTEVLKYLW